MPMIAPSITSFLVMALGLVLGGCHFPSLKLGQVIASRIFGSGHWIYMLITMAIWLTSMTLVTEVMSMLDFGALSFENRRRHVIYWVFGFLLGMYVGRIILRHFESATE